MMRAKQITVILWTFTAMCLPITAHPVRQAVSGLESLAGWEGVMLTAGQGTEGTAYGSLAIPGNATIEYREIHDWRPWDSLEFELQVPDDRLFELKVIVGFQFPALDFGEQVAGEILQRYPNSASATTVVSGGGRHRLVIPVSHFTHISQRDVWQFVKRIAFVGRFIAGNTTGSVSIDEITLTKLSAIDLVCPAASKAGRVGEVVEYAVTVRNNNKSVQTVRLSVRKNGMEVMPTEISPQVVRLNGGQHRECVLRVRVVDDVSVGGQETQRLLAVPNGNGARAAEAEFVTVRYRPHPYILLTEDAWQDMPDKVRKHTWAREILERLMEKADRWNVPSTGCANQGIFSHFDANEAMQVAIAWKLTGNEEYRDKAAEFLRRLCDPRTGYPSLPGGTVARPQRATDNMVHEGQYFGRIAPLYDLLYDENVLTEEDHRNLRHTIELFLVSAELALREGGTSNYEVTIDSAAICCSLVLQDMARLNRYIHGPFGFAYQMSSGIMGDGWWHEGATNYHCLVADEGNLAAQACHNWGLDLFNMDFPAIPYRNREKGSWVKNGYLGMMFDIWGPPGGAYRSFRQLYDALIPFMNHQGVILSNNDSEEMKVAVSEDDSPGWKVGNIYEQAYLHYRDPAYAWVIGKNARDRWQSLLYGVGDLPAVEDPRTKSAFAENVGLAVLRSQGEQEAPEEQIQAAVKWGSHGGWHGHFDRTNFLSMQRYGRSFYTTMEAWYGYHSPMYKIWVQPSVSHNMVVVDEYQQEPVESRLLLFAPGKLMQACAVETRARWCQIPRWPFQKSGPDDMGVYYDPTQTPVLQRRLMVVTDDYIILDDYLKSDQEHTFDWLIHPVGFRRLEAASKTFLKHEDQASADSAGSYKHILDCSWHAITAPALAEFQDGILKMDIRALWPQQTEMMLGTFPVPEGTFTTLVFELSGDGKTLAAGEFHCGLLDKREVDVSLEGVTTLRLRAGRRGPAARRSVAWGNPRLETAGGESLLLADLELKVEDIARGGLIGEDYYGGPIQIVGRHYEHGIMAEPEGEMGTITVNIGGLGAVGLKATLGVDYPTGKEKETRRTFLSRTRGKQARYLTLVEPYRDAAVVTEAAASGPDNCRVYLSDGRVQTISIDNMDGGGDDLSITMVEKRGNVVLREETLW